MGNVTWTPLDPGIQQPFLVVHFPSSVCESRMQDFINWQDIKAEGPWDPDNLTLSFSKCSLGDQEGQCFTQVHRAPHWQNWEQDSDPNSQSIPFYYITGDESGLPLKQEAAGFCHLEALVSLTWLMISHQSERASLLTINLPWDNWKLLICLVLVRGTGEILIARTSVTKQLQASLDFVQWGPGGNGLPSDPMAVKPNGMQISQL